MRRLTARRARRARLRPPSMPAEAYLKLGARVGGANGHAQVAAGCRSATSSRTAASPASPRSSSSRRSRRAFATWAAVASAQISSEFVGFTSASPVQGDGATVLGFQNRPDLDRTLGATSFLIDTTTGDIVESDIFFNSAFPWSVAAAGADERLRSRVDCAARDRSPARARALGARRDRAARRRTPGARRRVRHVPDRVLARQHLRPHAQGGRHRRHLRHLPGGRVRRATTGSISGKVTKSGTRRARRARRRLQPADRQAHRRLLAERRRHAS